MRIFFDHQIFMLQRFGGISRYFYELMNQLNGFPENQLMFPLLYSNNHYIRKASFFNSSIAIPEVGFPFKHNIIKYYNKKNILKNCQTLENQKFDVFHPTYYDPYFLKYIKNIPFVLTVHDMIQEIYPDNFVLNDEISRNKKLLAQKASRIIAVSQNTKNDIIKYLRIPESKIDVVCLGNSLKLNLVRDIKKLPKRYILFVGNRIKYKNFNFFLQSITPILQRDKELFLIAAGGNKFSKEELQLFANLDVKSQIVHYKITDDTILCTLYNKARAFVFPSLYEGFGIPILEAFACKCPAVISCSGSLKEVGGDAAEYFDPKSSDSIVAAIAKVIYNDALRLDMINKGSHRLTQFSWEKMADKVLEIYKKVV